MTSLVRDAVRGSPVTFVGGVAVAATVVVATDPVVGALVFRSWTEGVGPARAALGGMSLGTPLAAWVGTTALVTVLGAIVAVLVERSSPPTEDDSAGWEARRSDRAVNRVSGAMVAAAGIWLLAGGGGVGTGTLLGLVALALGVWLVARPDEGRDGYRVVAGTVRPDHGAAGVAADPLFRTWSEGVRARMRREPESESSSAPKAGGTSAGGPDKASEGARAPRPPVVDGVADPWSVLGLEPDAPLEQVTRRWKRLCKRYHPDVVPRGLQSETLEAVKKINAAYQVIRETLRRKGQGRSGSAG